MKIDITSDIHIDFWIAINGSVKKQQGKMRLLIEKLLPEEKADTLVIAGDIGHYNHQNKLMFEVLREYYKDIIWVHGNHDLYMVSGSVKKKFDNDSFIRLDNMIKLADKIDGVHYLNGNIVEIEGTKFGGCGMWYNYDYAKTVWGMTHIRCIQMWNDYLNDANLIRVPWKGIRGQIDNERYFDSQLELLNKIYLDSDVIVTHVNPDWEGLLPKWKMPESTFYVFDGREMLNNLDENKMWIYGHTHDKIFYSHPAGCTMICNPLDYAIENWWDRDLSDKKFITMEVGKLKSYDDVFKDLDEK